MTAQEGQFGVDGLLVRVQERRVAPAGQPDQLRTGHPPRRTESWAGERGPVLVADDDQQRAPTTHKVLLYHFDGTDDLLKQAILRLRERRISNAPAAAAQGPDDRSLADRVRAMWPVLMGAESGLRVLDQAIGLAMYDPGRYGEFVREASAQYLPSLRSICPEHWSERRKSEVAEMILAVLRGFLVDWLTSGDTEGVDAGFDAPGRALEREEAAPA